MALKMALVGCGSMGSALLKGWLSLIDSLEQFEKIWVIAPHPEKVKPFLTDARVHWLHSADDLPQSPDLILFAVKPSLLEDILPSYASHNSLFISVAAGKSLSFYQKFLPRGCPLVRAMPNTPVMVHQGVIGLLSSAKLTNQQEAMVMACFQGLGFCLWVASDEDLDKLTAISGSGPAYVFVLIEALARSAESLGLDSETSLSLALHTFLGAASYAEASGEAPSLLRQRVTSPGGTTAAALRVLETGRIADLIKEAANAAYHRARELRE